MNCRINNQCVWLASIHQTCRKRTSKCPCFRIPWQEVAWLEKPVLTCEFLAAVNGSNKLAMIRRLLAHAVCLLAHAV